MTQRHIDVLSTASPEDLAQMQALSHEEMARVLQQGLEERREAEACESSTLVDPRIWFR